MRIPVITNLHYSKRLVFGAFALMIFMSSYWLWLDYKDFQKTLLSIGKEPGGFVVAKGSGVNRLAEHLTSQGILSHPYYFKLLVALSPELAQIKAGEYRFQQDVTPREFLIHLNQGVVIQYPFTIIDGQTAYQIFEKLNRDTNLIGLSEAQQANITQQLGIEHINIEGWLMPETYSYSRGEDAFSLLKRSSDAMKRFLASEWKQRELNLPYENQYQALIMASIIEKETGISSERAEVAGVFVRRLRKNMRLGTDPTVIYGIGPEFNGDITRKDLRTPTPYNTYLIKGLPPTPIAMPGKESIYAALHPADGTALYFVADGTGGHYFSDNLAEHNRAVQRMLRRNRNKKN